MYCVMGSQVEILGVVTAKGGLELQGPRWVLSSWRLVGQTVESTIWTSPFKVPSPQTPVETEGACIPTEAPPLSAESTWFFFYQHVPSFGHL